MVDFSAVTGRLPDRESLVAALERMPRAAGAASPFVAGEGVDSAVAAVREAMSRGMTASVAYLPLPDAMAVARLANLNAIEALSEEDLTEGNDLIVDLAHFGLKRGGAGAVAADVAAAARAAAAVGMSVTIAGLAHHLVDDGLAVRARLVEEFPDLGVTIAANLHRSEADVLDLARAGARVRLLRRESPESSRVAFMAPNEIDRAYVRCLRMAVDGGARTVVATHDGRLQEIAAALAERSERESVDLTIQFRMGVTPERADSLLASGSHVSVLVPFGPAWANYVTRRIALKPSSVGVAARALVRRDAADD